MTILFWILTYTVIWLIAGFYYLVNGRIEPSKMIVITTPNYETGEVVEKTINSLTGQVFKVKEYYQYGLRTW